MNAATINKVKEIFQAAVDLPPTEQELFVRERCASDTSLRDAVSRLLRHESEGMGDFLCRPAFTPAPDMMPLDAQDPPERIGRYAIIRRIGEGGMGVVYEAQQENPRRTVALKVIRSGLPSTEMIRRFRHEAEALGHLQHPGIACIYEAGVSETGDAGGAQPFFAMELIHGSQLSAYAAEQALDMRERLELVAEICIAVQHAHLKGVIHRDLKPDNILIDQTGQPKILDFGVARAADTDVLTTTLRTAYGQMVGTIPYMSPEQVTGDPKQLDTRSDVYALGVILYELLCGMLPLDVQHLPISEAAQKILQEDPPSLSSIDKTFRGDVETIVARALEKDKTRRYQSASDLNADIRRYLKGQPIEAKRDSTLYVLRKTLYRHCWAAATAVCAVVGLGAFAIFATVQAGRYERLAQDERATRQQSVADREEAIGQREAARASAARARVETAKAEAVTHFLQNMLAAVDPSVTPNPDITVREVLDEAARELEDGSLTQIPGVEASIRETLGRTYLSVGRYADAEQQFRESLLSHREHHAIPDSVTATRLKRLGTALVLLGRLSEGEAVLVEAVSVYRSLSLDNTLEMTDAMNYLAEINLRRHEYDLAEQRFRDVLALRRKIVGDNHTSVANCLNNLAVTLRKKGNFAAAESAYRESLELNRSILGDKHIEIANTLSNLGMLRAYQGDIDEAEKLLVQALTMRRSLLGNSHPKIATTLNGLAGMLHLKGEYDRAEALYLEALTLRQDLLGSSHPKVALVNYNLSRLLYDRGTPEDALPFANKAVAFYRTQIPPR